MVIWRGLTSAQRQARKIISDPSPTAKTRLLPCNRIQSRVVTSLLAGHNTLSRHTSIYITGLIDSPLWRRCGAEEEASSHVSCECEALATLRHLGSFILDPEDNISLSLGAIWNFINPLNPELNPICYLLALLGAHHFLHVSRIRVKSLTLRLLMSYIYIYIYIWSTHSWCF